MLAPLYAPAPPIAAKPMRSVLPHHEANQALVVHPEGETRNTVFYFPGCGSERLHTDIGLAAIYMLLQSGARVVLPPKHLCCGYPARANAKADLSTRQELRNTFIFNQMRSMLGYYEFSGCIVSCGTCSEALARIGISEIFDAPVVDITQFVISQGMKVRLSGDHLYHTPCHDSLEGSGIKLLEKITSGRIKAASHCCSEAGTLALSRPDIAAAMFERKRRLLRHISSGAETQPRLITNCPACLNGLGRQRMASCHHMAVAMANAAAEGEWKRSVAARLAASELIRF